MIGALLAQKRIPEWFEAMNRHDLEALLKDYAEDAVMVYPGDVDGVSGTFKGKAALQAWYRRYFDQFPVVQQSVKHIAVSNIFDMVGNNVIAVEWEAEVENRDGLQVHNHGVAIITSRRGKAVHITVYMAVTGDKFRDAWGVGSA